MHACMYVSIYMYTYIERQREGREREKQRKAEVEAEVAFKTRACHQVYKAYTHIYCHVSRSDRFFCVRKAMLRIFAGFSGNRPKALPHF